MKSLIIFTTLMSITSATATATKPTKTVLITGANSGVGFAATKILASTNKWNVIMACRNPEKAFTARNSLGDFKENVQVVKLDLADLQSVKELSESLKGMPIDCLVCNAGIQESTTGLGGKESKAIAKRTKQDYEVTVGTNHIGHFLLLNKLLPNVKSAKDGRIVIVGSGVHDPESPGGKVGSKATLGDLSGLKLGFKSPISMVDNSEYDPDKAYKDSKLCNVMTSFELARRLLEDKSTVTCNVLNPGLIPTSVAVTEEDGGQCVATMVQSEVYKGTTGGYFSAIPGPGGQAFGPIVASKEARDETKAKLLWQYTEQLVKDYM